MAAAKKTRAELNEARLQVGVKMQNRSEQAAAKQVRANELRSGAAAIEGDLARMRAYQAAAHMALLADELAGEAARFAIELTAIEVELAALDAAERLAEQHSAFDETAGIEVAA